MRELEDEIRAIAKGADHRDKILELMAKKALIGDVFNHLRLGTQPLETPTSGETSFCADEEGRRRALAQLLMLMVKLDHEIGPMVEQEGRDLNARYVLWRKLRFSSWMLPRLCSKNWSRNEIGPYFGTQR